MRTLIEGIGQLLAVPVGPVRGAARFVISSLPDVACSSWFLLLTFDTGQYPG